MRSRKERGERGAALVEAAIIMPLVIILTFGIIEFGFAFNEQGTVRSATRSAARAIAAVPKADNISAGGNFEHAGIDALNAALSNLNSGDPTFALIYDATNAAIVPNSCAAAAGPCLEFNDWDDVNQRFTTTNTGAEWTPAQRNACAGQTDRVGVYVEVEHNYLTGLPGFIPGMGDAVTLNARTVMALEPVPGHDCGG